MRSSASIARSLVVLALATILLTNSIAFSAYAVGRPPTATPTQTPDPPSNGKIAFARVDADYTINGIYLINPDGSGEARIPGTQFDTTPVWSPDGLHLAVVTPANQHSGDVSGWGVEIINADGTGRVRLNDNMEPGERVAWSPDGAKIAFTSWSNFGPNADIMVMNADGSNLVNLTNDPSYDYLPSWSPDGTKITFTSNRSGNLDVFVMNADGSNQQNITNYYANDYYPSWSPDGSKIVFVSSGRGGTFDNDEICVMNGDGSNVVNLTVNQVADLMPAWSPDGSEIIFNSDRNGNRDLYSMNADGSNQTRVTVHTAEDSRASWQTTPISTPTPTPTPQADLAVTVDAQPYQVEPGGTLVFDSVVTNYGPSPASDVNLDIYVPPYTTLDNFSAPGGTCTTTTYPDGAGYRIFCSFGDVGVGDARAVAISVTITAIDGASMQSITTVSSSTFDPNSTNDTAYAPLIVRAAPTPTPTPTPEPGGTKIAFVSERDGNQEIYVMNADGSDQTNISNNSLESWSSDFDPVWSPDGSKIAFASNRDTFAGLYIMNADGGNVVNISGVSGTSPTWSPDGTQLAYMSNLDIYKVNIDGTNPTKLTNTANNTKPSWSPDGQFIAFQNFSQSEIYVMGQDGSNPTRLTTTTGMGAYEPKWSPDGSKIVFHSYRGNFEIFTMNADGSNQTQITNNTAEDFGGSWSPDGSKIIFTSMRDGSHEIYVMDTDGNNQTRLTDVPFKDYSPSWQRIPPPTPTPTPEAEVSVGASADPIYVATGGHVNYTVYLTNLGPAVAADVTLTSQFPAGVTLDTINDDAGGSCAPAPDGANFICTFASLNPFESKLVRVTATSNVAGAPYSSVTTYFTATSATPDSNPGNNTGSIEFLIAAPPLPTPTPGPANDAQFAYTLFDPNSSQTDIFRRRADGAGLLNLTSDPRDERDFVWSPDGSKLAFVRYTYANPTTNADIYVMNADGTNLVQLTTSPDEYDVEPAWAHDGTKLAFISRTPNGDFAVVHTINADGSDLRTFSPPDGFDGEAAFSPDGTHVSFVRRSYITPDSLTPGYIYVVNADGTNPVQIDHPADVWDMVAVWSPDSTHVAFNRFAFSGAAPNDIYTARPDGTDLHNLTNNATGGSGSPLWSPNGTQIAFVNYDAGYLLQVMNSDGSNRHTIYDAAGWSASPAVWSPDGTKLTFWSQVAEASQGDVYVVNADGSGLIRIGDDLERNTNPDWSPDSQRLVFLTSRNGVAGINIVNADGTGRVDLTNALGYYGAPKWRPVPQGNTPAGANVTVTSNGVTLNFSNVTTAGETTVTPIDPNSLSGVPGEYVINANSLAFEIHTTAVYTGPITIGFQVPSVNNPITFSALRVLHGEPPPVPNFVDRTVLAPDTPAPNFATRTIYARVTSLSPFLIAELRPNLLTALGPAQVWIGLKNSDDVGTKFDLLAEVFKNGTLIGSGQLNNVAGGSSGFNNAKLNAISLALSGTPAFGPGTTLSIRLSVRIAASSGHRSGTARLWFNDSAANSRFSATIGGVTNNYYLRKPSSSLVLTTATGGTAKITIDVLVDRAVGGNPFKPFGTWSITF